MGDRDIHREGLRKERGRDGESSETDKQTDRQGQRERERKVRNLL